MKRLLLAVLTVYRTWLSPAVHAVSPMSCKFEPSCSRFAIEAIEVHGAMRGGTLALQRLARCHPFTRGGFDPVPLAFVGAATIASLGRPTGSSSNSPGNLPANLDPLP